MENDSFLVAFRARMLASPHSVSENGAPAAGFSPAQRAQLIYSPGAEVGSFQACAALLRQSGSE
jgi:hypothetical protein